MAKIGEAYVELSARLEQLKTGLDQAQTAVRTSVAEMSESIDAALGKDLVNRVNQQLETVNQTAQRTTTNLAPMRGELSLVALGLSQAGVQVPGFAIGMMTLSRLSPAVKTGLGAVSEALTKVIAAAGPVGLITAAAVGTAIYAWKKYTDSLNNAVEAHKKLTQQQVIQFQAGIENRLGVEEAIQTKIADMRGDSRAKELIAIDQWERQLLLRTTAPQTRALIVKTADEARAKVDTDIINADRQRRREQQWEQENENKTTLEKAKKTAGDMALNLRNLSRQASLSLWGATGQEGMGQKLQAQFNLNDRLDQLEEYIEKLKQAGYWSKEWADYTDQLRTAIYRAADAESRFKNQDRFATVTASFGEALRGSIGDINVPQNITMAGGAQENTARTQLGVLVQIKDILSNKGNPALVAAYQ